MDEKEEEEEDVEMEAEEDGRLNKENNNRCKMAREENDRGAYLEDQN